MVMNFAAFFRQLHQEMQEQPSNAVFLYVMGKNLAKRNLPRLAGGVRAIESNKDVARIVEEFRAASIGSLKLHSTNQKRKEFVFTLKNSIFRTGLKRHSCSVVCGMLAGIVETVSGYYTGALETTCVSMGNAQCEFKVKIVGKAPLQQEGGQ